MKKAISIIAITIILLGACIIVQNHASAKTYNQKLITNFTKYYQPLSYKHWDNANRYWYTYNKKHQLVKITSGYKKYSEKKWHKNKDYAKFYYDKKGTLKKVFCKTILSQGDTTYILKYDKLNRLVRVEEHCDVLTPIVLYKYKGNAKYPNKKMSVYQDRKWIPIKTNKFGQLSWYNGKRKLKTNNEGFKVWAKGTKVARYKVVSIGRDSPFSIH